MVGNGVTDHQIDGNALVPFAHGMGLISDYMFEVCSYAWDSMLSKISMSVICIDNYTN